MDKFSEQKRLRGFLLWCLAILLAFLYVGLHLGHAAYDNTDALGVIDWGSAISQFTEELLNPLAVYPSMGEPVFLLLLAGSIVCLYGYQDFARKVNTMPGREHGSAAFNTDYRKLQHDFIMSPELLIRRELDRQGITDPQQRRARTRQLEAKGHYAVDRKVKEQTGRRICRARRFKKDEIAWCTAQSQLYSKRVALSMDTSMTQLNLNSIVFGGSGTGKSRYFVKPNLLQANSSYVVTDPSGELMMSCGKFLEQQGYVIKCFNIEDMTRSNRYNPFAYVNEDADIPVMVGALIDNIEGPKKGGSGDNKFWDETSRTLLIAVCGYLFETQPMERRNFNNVLRLLDMADVSDEREEPEDDLDRLFRDLELANPESYAVSQYKVIKQAGTGKTAQNIIISTTAIFARFFRLDRIANLTYRDELHLEEIGQKKCALFIVTPQGDTTYNFLASLLYTQLFATLYRQGEEQARRTNTASVRLQVPVRCLIDEAANIGVIPHFAERLATMRKYGISCVPIYQNQSQVKALFRDNWETICGNCDTMLFLGGIDASTVKMVSERLGKGTINTRSENTQRGRRGTTSEGMNTAGRELMTTTEIEQMDNTRCITFIRSMKPFRDFKYPYEQHPNYRFTGDADPDNNYYGDFALTFDRSTMRSIAVRRASDPDYVKPARVEGVLDAEVERAERIQAKTRPASAQLQRSGRFVPEGRDFAETAGDIAGAGEGFTLYRTEDETGEEEDGIYEDMDRFNEVLLGNLQQNPLGRMLLKME